MHRSQGVSFRLRQTASFVALVSCGVLSMATSDCDDYFETRTTELDVEFAAGQTEVLLDLQFEGDFVLLSIEGLLTVHSSSGEVESAPFGTLVRPVPMEPALGGMGGLGFGEGGDAAVPVPPVFTNEFPDLSCESQAQSLYERFQGEGQERTLVCWGTVDGPVVRLVRSEESKQSVKVAAEVFEQRDGCDAGEDLVVGVSLERVE